MTAKGLSGSLLTKLRRSVLLFKWREIKSFQSPAFRFVEKHLWPGLVKRSLREYLLDHEAGNPQKHIRTSRCSLHLVLNVFSPNRR